MARRERITVWRNGRGRFVPRGTPGARRIPGVLVPRDPRTGQFGPGRAITDRHPRSGRYISRTQAGTLRKTRITSRDVARIFEVSPKMKRALTRFDFKTGTRVPMRGRTRERAIASITKNVRKLARDFRMKEQQGELFEREEE